MTHAPAQPALVVRGPDSLPALVPHLVGFHPAASLVLLGLEPERRTVRVTVRIDLPEAGVPVVDVVDAWSVSLAALARAAALEAVLVVYPREADSPWSRDEPTDLPHRDLVDELAAELRDAGVLALDAVCVVGDRIRSYWCLDLACCPAEGRLVDSGEALRVRSLLVEQGSAPLSSREELVRGLAPRDADDPVRQAVDDARDAVLIRMPAGTEIRVDRFVDDVRELGLDPRNRAALTRLVVVAGWLCATIRSRDLLLRALTVDPDPTVLHTARTVLGEAVRCASGPDAAPVASVLAVCAWVAGDGAAARVALDRALDADPSYSLAALVAAALDAGTPPWTWVSLMSELSVDAILGRDADDGLAAGA
ncbi:MAG: DUF4192 domain-containing protein [Actinomycetales bacterium]|nr:DUF4192 domain-containing protein [Actinomycetales bacterium]